MSGKCGFKKPIGRWKELHNKPNLETATQRPKSGPRPAPDQHLELTMTIRMRPTSENICDHRTRLGEVVEASIKRVAIKVRLFLEVGDDRFLQGRGHRRGCPPDRLTAATGSAPVSVILQQR